MSPTIMSGVSPASSTASAPPSTATISGRLSRMKGRSARRSRWCSTPRTTSSVERSRNSVWKRGRAIRPVSSSRSSRMCSIVLLAKRSSASPTSRRRASVSARTRAQVEHLAAAEQLPAAEHLRVAPPGAQHARARRLGADAARGGRRRRATSNRRVVGHVDERDAGFDEQQRAEVRVGAARGRPAVDDSGDLGGDQLLGGDPVDVEVVDQRDVAWHEMLHEQLRAPPGTHGPGDGRCGGAARGPARARRRAPSRSAGLGLVAAIQPRVTRRRPSKGPCKCVSMQMRESGH